MSLKSSENVLFRIVTVLFAGMRILDLDLNYVHRSSEIKGLHRARRTESFMIPNGVSTSINASVTYETARLDRKLPNVIYGRVFQTVKEFRIMVLDLRLFSNNQ